MQPSKKFLNIMIVVLFIFFVNMGLIVAEYEDCLIYGNCREKVPELNSYAEMYISEDTPTVFNYTATMTYINLTANQTKGLTKNFNFSNGKITTELSGNYEINYHVSFSGQTGSVHGFGVGVNGIKQDNCYCQRKLGSVDVGNIADGCLLSLNIGDVVTLISDDEDAIVHDITVVASNLRIKKIGI